MCLVLQAVKSGLEGVWGLCDKALEIWIIFLKLNPIIL